MSGAVSDPDGLRQIKQRLQSLAISHHTLHRAASSHHHAAAAAARADALSGLRGSDSGESKIRAEGGGGDGSSRDDKALKADGAGARGVVLNVMLLTGSGTHSQHHLLKTLARVLYDTGLTGSGGGAVGAPVLVIEGREYAAASPSIAGSTTTGSGGGRAHARQLYEMVNRQLIACPRSMVGYFFLR